MQPQGARPSHEPARFWSRTTDRAFALVFALGTGVCSAPPALADGFIFQVSPDGRLIDTTDTTSTLRSFTDDEDAQNGALPDRLFLFAAPQSQGDDAPLRHIAQGIIVPTGLRYCEEKEAIWKGPILGIVVASERAKAARGLGRVDQSAIGADLEDETVGPSL